MSHKIILTADGSHSLHVDALDEQYHSVHGAVQESKHVFIANGLMKVKETSSDINVLEVGFGTGLNALLTFLAREKGDTIHYTSLEAFPLERSLIDQLNYAEKTNEPSASVLWKEIHDAPWNEKVAIDITSSIHKKETKLEDFDEQGQYNLVYYDAFAPSKQPEMWEKPMLAKMYNALQKNGVFVTYCAKGQVRRDLQSLGFEVERLPGPPGKHHMLRAIKI